MYIVLSFMYMLMNYIYHVCILYFTIQQDIFLINLQFAKDIFDFICIESLQFVSLRESKRYFSSYLNVFSLWTHKKREQLNSVYCRIKATLQSVCYFKYKAQKRLYKTTTNHGFFCLWTGIWSRYISTK